MTKLRQIAIEPPTADQPAIMWGLCRNGTLWMRELGYGNPKWIRVAAPPDAPAMPRRIKAAAAAMAKPAGMRVSGGAGE